MFPADCVLMQKDYYYEYTECDSTGSRWRVAIPQIPGDCVGLPEPVRGTECSKCLLSLSAGWNSKPVWVWMHFRQPQWNVEQVSLTSRSGDKLKCPP